MHELLAALAKAIIRHRAIIRENETWGRCEADRYPNDVYFEGGAIRCNAPGSKYRPDVELVLCNYCYKAVC
jgi:hypothetical protein